MSSSPPTTSSTNMGLRILAGPRWSRRFSMTSGKQVPDIELAIEDIVEHGDKVWMRMRGRGTHVFGKRVEVDVIDICRFEDGLMVEHWGVPDRFAPGPARRLAEPTRTTLSADTVCRGQEARPPERGAQVQDLRVPPGNRLEALKGDLRGKHSIRINDQWRVVFRWKNGDAHDVEIDDYH